MNALNIDLSALTGKLVPLPAGPLENGLLCAVLLRDLHGPGRHGAAQLRHVGGYWVSDDEANAYGDGPQTVEEAEHIILGKVEGAPPTYFVPLVEIVREAA